MGVYTESAKRLINDENAISAMNTPLFMIECAETEHKLFEAVIELDFVEAYNESGLICLSEEETAAADNASKTTFKEKIKKVWNDFIAAITNAFNAVMKKIDALIKGSGALVGITKLLDDPKASNCKVEQIWYKDLEDFYDQRWNTVTSTKYTQNPAEAIEFLKHEADPEDAVKPVVLGTKIASGKEDLKKRITFANIGRDIKAIFEGLKKPITYENYAQNANDEMGKFKAATALTKFRLQLFSFKCNSTLKVSSTARKNFVTIAQFVKAENKAAGKEAKAEAKNDKKLAKQGAIRDKAAETNEYDSNNESAMRAGELSDFFCESIIEEI